MDINHIELPAFAIAELYSDSLIGETGNIAPAVTEVKTIVKEKPIAVTVKETAPWRFLGDNKKNILVVVKSDKAVHLPDHELQFLTGILGACKLNLADVAIVNIHDQAAGYKELTTHFKSRVVFLFDVEPADFDLPMNFPQYQVQAFSGSSYLYSPALEQLEHDKVEKSKLWVCLKRLFNL